jgi:hypothetical protein
LTTGAAIGGSDTGGVSTGGGNIVASMTVGSGIVSLTQPCPLNHSQAPIDACTARLSKTTFGVRVNKDKAMSAAFQSKDQSP